MCAMVHTLAALRCPLPLPPSWGQSYPPPPAGASRTPLPQLGLVVPPSPSCPSPSLGPSYPPSPPPCMLPLPWAPQGCSQRGAAPPATALLGHAVAPAGCDGVPAGLLGGLHRSECGSSGRGPSWGGWSLSAASWWPKRELKEESQQRSCGSGGVRR